MSAQERLVVIFAGSDPRSGVEIPPAVPIGELLDALDTTARTEDGAPIRSKITTRHPLQPFDVANFVPGGLGSRAGFSFDRAGLRAVRAAVPGASARLRQSSAESLCRIATTDGLVSLSDLVRFFNHPIRALIYDRAGLWITRPDETARRADPGQPQRTGSLEHRRAAAAAAHGRSRAGVADRGRVAARLSAATCSRPEGHPGHRRNRSSNLCRPRSRS